MPGTTQIAALTFALACSASACVAAADDAPIAAAPEATWAFQPAPDQFGADAAFDLRSLNEQEAGEKGFVRLSADGNDFVLGDGTPVRFWGYNDNAVFSVDPSHRPPLSQAPWPPDPARNARFLAKRGVNMVRCFVDLTGSGDEPGAQDLDVLWRCVAEMKKQGIYTLLTPYNYANSRMRPGTAGVADNTTGSTKRPNSVGLLFFDPALRQHYKAWMKAALTTINPYTKLPLSQDPALAMIQLQNEDGLLWWTVDNAAKGPAGRELAEQFGAWLAKTHGSLDAATARWNGVSVKNDDLANKAPAMMGLWQMCLPTQNPGEEARRTDQCAFLTETMRAFNSDMVDFLAHDVGCKQLINAGNWKTGMAGSLNDAQRYADEVCPVMGVNRYYDLPSECRYNGWAIVDGDTYEDESVLTRPLEFPLTLKQLQGHPMIITETLWCPPLSYRCEGPLLMAAYGCLTGFDCPMWFANLNEETWRQPGSANGYLDSQALYAASTPMSMGQWPAAALLFRKGFVRHGEPVVQEHRTVTDIEGMLRPILVEHGGGDPMRDKEITAKGSGMDSKIDEHAYLVGPVVVSYGDKASSAVVSADLGHLIDAAKGEARSNTGELCWNWKDGVCTVDAPKAQGACGFLGSRGAIALKDITITCKNRYASIVAVALDDQPLARSAKILVQIGTIEEPTGWKVEPAVLHKDPAFKVLAIGKAPWQVAEADATVAIGNPGLGKMRTLDANFEQVAVSDLAHQGGTATCALPKDSLYILLTAN